MSNKAGVSYTTVDAGYFEKRGLRRYAGVWSLWALGVGAVISGHFSGWNFGLQYGWGSMLIATIIIAVMRSEEHTSELQSLMRISYAVFCLKKKMIISCSILFSSILY